MILGIVISFFAGVCAFFLSNYVAGVYNDADSASNYYDDDDDNFWFI